MSIEIIYDRCFIRCNDIILPVVLMGSSNCTMFHNGKEILERNWCSLSPLTVREQLSADGDSLMSAVKSKWSTGCEVRRNGKNICGDEFVRFFENGVKNALSLEDVISVNPISSLEVSLYAYEPGTRKSTEFIHEFVRNTEELANWLKKADDFFDKHEKPESLYLKTEFYSIKPLKKKQAPRKNGGPVIAKCGKNGYLKDFVKDRSLHFGKIEEAYVFESVEAGYEKIGTCWRNVRFVSAKNKEVVKNYVILCLNGTHANLYVKNRSRTALHFVYGPQSGIRFKSERDALVYIDKIHTSGWPNLEFKVINIAEKSDADV